MISDRRTPWIVCAVGLAVAACTDPTVAPPSPVKVAFTVQPGSATAGEAISPIAVAIEDASGELVSGATTVVTVAIATNPAGGSLTGTTRVAATNGIATFSNLHVDKAGAGYTLAAWATGLTQATSALFDITAGAATRLAFAVQPNNAIVGVALRPPVQVAVEDSFGNRVAGFQDSVTVALGGNAAPGALRGTIVTRASNGVATFSDLSIATANPGYALTASATGLAGAVSSRFDIAPEPIIVFSSHRGIEGIQPDGSGRTVLIADSLVSEPAWSPNGAKLAFTRVVDFYTCEIYTAAADGSGAHQITGTIDSFPYPRCASNPSWSPDGTRIAFSVYPGFDTGATYIMNANGSDVRELIADVAPGFGYPGGPTWSPDGTQLAFECWGGDITLYVCIMNADGTAAGDLTPAGGCEWAPAWSPDGAEVAFVGSCEDGGPYAPNGPFGIWLKHPDGSSARNLTAGSYGADEFPAWSPDGTELVFARGDPADLYIVNRDGSGLRQLTSTPDISETFPSWRPATPARLALTQTGRHGSRHP